MCCCCCCCYYYYYYYYFLPEVPWIPQALHKLSGDFKTKCILGWLRLVKILLLKRAIKGNSIIIIIRGTYDPSGDTKIVRIQNINYYLIYYYYYYYHHLFIQNQTTLTLTVNLHLALN